LDDAPEEVRIGRHRSRFGAALVVGALLVAALAAAGRSAPRDDYPIEPGCREQERWPVKVLADPGASKVNFRPVSTTVEALLRLPHPPRLTARTPRLAPHELTTYRVRAFVVAARRNVRTDDMEVVLRGAGEHSTLVAVFPDERCPTFATSAKADDMHAAEHEFTGPCGSSLSSTSWTKLRGRATVTGVGFFALRRSSTYSAANTFELHPVMEFRSVSCIRP
jgi:hypothetical protein